MGQILHKAVGRLIFRLLLAAVLVSGCTAYEHPVPPLDAATRANIAEIGVAPESGHQTGEIDQPFSGKGKAALLYAGTTILAGIMFGVEAGASTGDSVGFVALTAFGTALGIVAAPVAAVIGAVSTPSTEDVESARRTIIAAVDQADWESQFVSSLGQTLRDWEPPSAATMPARMDFALEGPWLVITNKGAIPTVTVHAVLHVGDACALDRRWRWNGGANDYVNLGRNDASPYRDAMGRAIELLASVIAWDLFQSTEPRMVAFRSEKSVLKGEPPLAVIDPLSHMGTIASWDTVAPNSFGREICQGFSTQSGSPVEMIKHTHHF